MRLGWKRFPDPREGRDMVIVSFKDSIGSNAWLANSRKGRLTLGLGETAPKGMAIDGELAGLLWPLLKHYAETGELPDPPRD